MKLLENIKGLEYLPMNRAEGCCGFGGTFTVKQPEISAVMTREKAMNIYNSGAKCSSRW